MYYLKNLVLLIFIVTSPFVYANGQKCSASGSSNSILTPSMVTNGAWYGSYIITNVSNEPVVVRIELTDSNGANYTPTDFWFRDGFSASNNPLNTGATLQPGQLGAIGFPANDQYFINVGKLSWESTACLESALMANYLNEMTEVSRYNANLVVLNNGMPF